MTNQDRLEALLLQRDIEALFYAEAELLDNRQFEQWLDLFTEDLEYFMPLRRNVKFGEHAARENTRSGLDSAWFDEGKETLTQRVKQIATGIHWAEEPLSRVSHLITNVQVLTAPVNETTAEIEVRSRFLVYRNRVEDETDLFVGRRHDRLRRTGADWQVCRRTILLEQNVLLAKNLTIFF